MNQFHLLDCTLRDGGYINQWAFPDSVTAKIVQGLALAGMDMIEVGYLNNQMHGRDRTQFADVREIARLLPQTRDGCLFLAMADAGLFAAEDLSAYDKNSVDGIRVVFYKHQVDQALQLADAVKEKGYLLFLQPMVTIDYSIDEYARLIEKIAGLHPYAVSIVDSFGYMLKEDFRNYFRVLDQLLSPEVCAGFHSHNNMDLAFITAQDILEYKTNRTRIIDASLYGMGRGAGNLHTELIANYYNMVFGNRYDIQELMRLIGDDILPIYEKKPWGYSPYLFLTGLYHCHPNYACYLLEEFAVTVSEFDAFLHTIPDEMRTRCRKNETVRMWKEFQGNRQTGEMPK